MSYIKNMQEKLPIYIGDNGSIVTSLYLFIRFNCYNESKDNDINFHEFDENDTNVEHSEECESNNSKEDDEQEEQISKHKNHKPKDKSINISKKLKRSVSSCIFLINDFD